MTRRRSSVLLLALLAVALATMLATSFLSAQSTTIGIARNVENQSKARYVAESGLELAVAYIRSDSAWRTAKPNGTWVTNATFGEGTFTIVGQDGQDTNGDGIVDGDGDLTDDPTDLLTLTVTGQVNGASHVARVVATPVTSGGELTLRPDGTGSTTTLLGIGSGAGNWDRVNEETTDENSTFVICYQLLFYHSDTYSTQDSGMSSGDITGVTVWVRLRRGLLFGCEAKTVLRTGGGDYLGATINLSSTTYNDFHTDYPTNPNTGSAWTWAEIDAMEIGITGRTGTCCTQVYATVEHGGGGGGGYTYDLQWQ